MKPSLVSNISFGGPRLALADLRTAAQSEPAAFAAKLEELAQSGKIKLHDLRDLPGTFHALADITVPVHLDVMGRTREINTSAFPLLVGVLTIAGFVEKLAAVATIGQELVEDMPTNKKVTSLASISAMDVNVDTVDEGKDFPEIGAEGERVEIRSKRNGRQLALTMEVIEENNVAGFAQQVNALAEIASDWIEEQTLGRVCDKNGSRTTSASEPYVYHPNGVGTGLYSASANTPGVRAPSGTRVASNALTDETDLDAARAVLAAMKNNRGKRIGVWNNSDMILLVPDALVGTAAKIRNSDYTPGVENEVSNWGTRGRWQPRIVSSPKLDDISTTAWYLGAFKKQFKRLIKLPFEYVTLSGNTEAFVRRREAFRARIAWDMEVGATDYVYVVQCLSGSTYTP